MMPDMVSTKFLLIDPPATLTLFAAGLKDWTLYLRSLSSEFKMPFKLRFSIRKSIESPLL
jgi:hypothetical protein